MPSAAAAIMMTFLGSGQLAAQSTFTTAAGTQSWGTSANWSPAGVPNAVDAMVLFSSPVGGNQSINSFGVARTVGTMSLTNDSTNTFSITTTNTLNFDVSSGHAALTIAGAGDNLTTFASSLNVVLNDSLDLSVTNTTSTAADGALRINGVISGTGRIIKTGAGTVTLAGGNTFTGGLSVLEGTVRISTGAALGAVPGSFAADQIVLDGGTLEYTGSGTTSSSLRGFALGGSTGTISVTGSGTYQIGAAISNVTGQTGSLRKTGPGTLYLNPDSASTFSGGATIVSGTLQFGISGSVGTGMITLGSAGGGSATLESVRGGYTLSNNVTVAAATGGTLAIWYSGTGSYNSTFSGVITLNGDVTVRSDAITGQAMRFTGAVAGSGGMTKTGAGILRLENNNTGYSGTTTISEGTLQLGNGGTAGGIGTGPVINNSVLVVNRSNALTLNNGMNGSGTLIQAGTGTTTINNDNSYTGGTLVEKGTLQIGRSNSLGTGPVMLGSAGGGDATLENYLAGWTTANDITTAAGSGGTLTLAYTSTATTFGNAIFSGAITLNDDLVVRSEAGTGTAMRLTGTISGTGSITKIGAGVLRLDNDNNGYSGTTTISSGVLQLGNNTAAGGLGTGDVVNNAAFVILRSNAVALSGQISGTGTVAQSGSGTTTLSNANTYSGGTTVDGGVLIVTNTAGSATGTGSVTVAATLGGTGMIAPAGSNGVAVSGTVAPGVAGTNSGVGTLTFAPVNGSVTFQAGSGVVLEIGSSGINDKIVFNAAGSGVLDFSAMTAGGLAVTFVGGYTPALNDSFDLLDWAAVSGAGINGLNPGLLSLSTAGFDPSWGWDTSQFATAGVITIVTQVPEPARMLLVMMGGGALCLRRGREQQAG